MRKKFTVWIFAFLLTLGAVEGAAQSFYVVVGAFEGESNAQKFMGYVRSLRYSASYELNESNKLYYVYVLKTQSHAAAAKQLHVVQAEEAFKDAWIYSGQMGPAPQPVENVVQSTPIVEEPEEAEPEIEPAIVAAPAEPAAEVETGYLVEVPNNVLAAEPPEKVRGKLFRFLIKTGDDKVVQGEVHLVDFQRGRDIHVFRSGEYVDVTSPSAANNPMPIVCGVFGYKEVIKLVDYKNPGATAGATQDPNGAWVIPYQLERMKKGDVSVMYHVSFYKDAVPMLPDSKREMDELVNMMKDNPNYKIMIHGHCNGNHARKIIALGNTKNYFSVAGSKEHTGTAKELSQLRAEAVQAYLEENGVDKGRSQVYAWGGSNMLVPETGTSSKLNDRIEIEILGD
jgi:outer membrane protein OmpA-like peptidoglycan-associated protein